MTAVLVVSPGALAAVLEPEDAWRVCGQSPLCPLGSQVWAATPVGQDGEQNGLMGRVDEGVDEFFTKKVTKL